MAHTPYSRPDGVADIGPEELRLHERIEAQLLAVFGSYGYEPVRLATIEYRDLYRPERIGHELFHHLVLGRLAESRDFPVGDTPEPTNDVVLRPDFTTPAARRFAERVLDAGGKIPDDAPYRWSYAGQAFRDWPPRLLRHREFRQVGAELLGAPGPHADAEMLAMAVAGAQAVGLRRWALFVGHAGLYRSMLSALGVPEARLRIVANGLAWLSRVQVAAREAESFERFFPGALNRLRGLVADRARRRGGTPDLPEGDSTAAWRELLPACYRAYLVAEWEEHGARAAAQIADLAEPAAGVEELVARMGAAPAWAATGGPGQAAELATCLERAGSPTVLLSPATSRGIAYYTGVTWEVHAPALPTSDSDVCGGGRYEALTRRVLERAVATHDRALSPNLDDRALSGVGVAFGVERLAAALRAEGSVGGRARAGLVVAVQDPSLLDAAWVLAGRLRLGGVPTTLELPRPDGSMRALHEQYGRADHGGARRVLLVAPREWELGHVRLRDLADHGEVELPIERALAELLGEPR